MRDDFGRPIDCYGNTLDEYEAWRPINKETDMTYYFWLGREAEEMHYSWRVSENEEG